ncbi:MAG: hypothetical protein OXE99_08665 [Cellvibrionales bacterium]|nr:hypothetical protein [Cellvibrionales bacterium]
MIQETFTTALLFAGGPVFMSIVLLLFCLHYQPKLTTYIVVMIIFQAIAYILLFSLDEYKPYQMVLLSFATPLFFISGSIGLLFNQVKRKTTRIFGCVFVIGGYSTIGIQVFLYIASVWGEF